MLWRIKETPHKVLGSVHALPEGASIPDWVYKSYENVQRIVFEADHTDPCVVEAGVDISGRHLDYPGAEKIYAQAELLLKSAEINEPFDGLRPWKAAIFVMVMLMRKNGISFSNGIETMLHTHCKNEGLSVGFLEIPCRALEVFETCGEPYGCLRYFEYFLANIDSARKELSDIFNAWGASDINRLAVILHEKADLFPVIYNQLIFQRNEEWGPVAVKYMADKIPTLFVVGALHCVGANSFLKTLERHGFGVADEK